MTFTDTLQLALRNLRQAKLRTALTTMGVSIGIASLAGMVSLGVGLQDQTVGRLTKSGMFDAITVFPGASRNGFLFGRGGLRPGARGGRGADAAASTPAQRLDDDTIQKIAALQDVKDVYPTIRVPVEVKVDQFSEFTTAAATPMSAKGEGAFQTITFGTFFTSDTNNECMLSLDMAKRINPDNPQSLIGQVLTLSYAVGLPSTGAPASNAAPAGIPLPGASQFGRKEEPFTVVGIVERDPGGIAAVAGLSGLMLPMSKAKTISAIVVTGPQSVLTNSADKKQYASLTVKVTRAQVTQDVEDRVKAMGFQAISLNDALEGAKKVFIVLDIFLSLIGSIALAVSSLGIVNTMVMSILERTREIGVMKAIGGSDSDIRRIFLIEASVIGLLGGVAGIAIGWTVSRVISFGANWYIRSQGGTSVDLFSLPLWLIAGAIGFSIAVSLIAGSYPASRAAKLDPIQALRHD